MKVSSKKLITVALFLSPFLTNGCCQQVDSNPPRPNQVRGWQELSKGNGITAIGEFVVNKGESIDNGKVGLELVDTIRARSCRGTESTTSSAVVRFYRSADKHVLLEIELMPTSTRLINFSRPLVEEYGVDTIAIREINTKEGWILFELLQ